MDVKDLKSKIVEKEIMLEVRYDDFELETRGIVEDVEKVESGIKIILRNNTTVYTSYDYIIEDEEALFFMERISDSQELILALLKIIA